MIKNILFLLIIISSSVLSQTYKIEGIITDKDSGNPLSYASIRIDGTTMGTSSNYDGLFLLKTKQINPRLVFTYVGYKSDTLDVNSSFTGRYKIELEPEAVVLSEVVVTDEDPAYRIIREAIKRKKENRKGLETFDYKAYSKKIVTSTGKLAAVEETMLRGYSRVGEWEKEFIISQHRTENRKNEETMDFSFEDRYYIDFNADTLSLMMSLVYLPLAESAFDHYDYKLIKTTESGVNEVYTIQVIPRSKIQPLLEGEITIESSRYALNSVRLKTNEGVRFPYINGFELHFVQQLGLYDNYWLPNYVETKASMSVNVGGLLTVGTMGFNQFNNITEYNINSVIPDSIEIAVRSKHGFFTTDTSGNEPKPSDISRAEIDSIRQIPLTDLEMQAYTELDSTKKLENMIEVGGPLAALIPDDRGEERDTSDSVADNIFENLVKYGYFRNNRVQGITFGGRYDGRFLAKNLYLDAFFAYSLKREVPEGKGYLTYNIKTLPITYIKAGYFDNTQLWSSIPAYPDIINSLGVTFGLQDQYNYYHSKGFEVSLGKKIKRTLEIKLSYRQEEQKSLLQHQFQSIFGSKRTVRENPAILEGYDKRLVVNLSLGKNPYSIQMIPENGFVAQFDFSNNSLGSDFKYNSFRLAGMVKSKTFYDELFVSPYIHLFLEAAIVKGDVYGPQHTFTPNTAYSIYSPFGVFKGLRPYHYVGTEMIAAHLEHNWRTVPWQALGLDFITDLHLDFITGVSGLKMWNKSDYKLGDNLDDPYWEAYLGISRIFAMFRVDAFYNSNDLFGVRAALGVLF